MKVQKIGLREPRKATDIEQFNGNNETPLVGMKLFVEGIVTTQDKTGRDYRNAESFVERPHEYLTQKGYRPFHIRDTRKIYEKGKGDETITVIWHEEDTREGRTVQFRGLEQQVKDAIWDFGLKLD
jgi:hypothetical protein